MSELVCILFSYAVGLVIGGMGMLLIGVMLSFGLPDRRSY